MVKKAYVMMDGGGKGGYSPTTPIFVIKANNKDEARLKIVKNSDYKSISGVKNSENEGEIEIVKVDLI